MVEGLGRRLCIVLVCVLIGAPQLVLAAISASIDRATVERNESFNLELTFDGESDAEPDLSPLEQDFHIGSTRELRNMSIVNGQMTRSHTWIVSLMPKRPGQLTIPSISIGAQRSNTVTITVRESSERPPGEADVFITAEVDFDETYVQSQVLYKIKIYRAVATRQPGLRQPDFGGVEVLVEQVGDERTYEAVLNDRAYNVVERTLAIFPQESGEVTISPARFEARVLRDGRITGRKVFESEALTVSVKPIPPPPEAHPNAKWLPAREVELVDSWSREPGELRAGEPISRNITISALGQLETQIPAMDPPSVDGVNIYLDRPDLSRGIEAQGIRGIRTDQYAMIGVAGGTVRLPPVELPWWSIAAGEWRVAELPEQVVTILPGDEPVVAAPAPETESAAEPEMTDADRPAVASPFWRRIAELLGVVWLLTLGAWWWSSRPKRDARPPAPVPLHKQQAKHLKAARKAAASGDTANVRRALLDWARLEWPEGTPRSIGALASRVSAPLSEELLKLSRQSYGRDDDGFDGESLARALRSFTVLDDGSGRDPRDLLPPLMPET